MPNFVEPLGGVEPPTHAAHPSVSEQAASDDLHPLLRPAGPVDRQVLDARHQGLALQQLAEDHVVSIKPRSLGRGDEELKGGHSKRSSVGLRVLGCVAKL